VLSFVNVVADKFQKFCNGEFQKLHATTDIQAHLRKEYWVFSINRISILEHIYMLKISDKLITIHSTIYTESKLL
jgi:hypothetical protein